MKKTVNVRILKFWFFTALAAACLASVFAICCYRSGQHAAADGELTELRTGWHYEAPGGRADIPALPDSVPGGPQGLTICYRLPQSLPDTPVLEFISRQSSVEVFLDGQRIYSYGLVSPAPVGNLLGNARHVVSLPYDAGGREVSIRFASPYVTDHYRICAVTLGCQEAVTYRFVASSIDLTVFALFSVFFCLLTLFAAGFFRLRHVAFDASALMAFTLFILISATWVITDSNILQMLTPNFQVVYFISHITFMMIPLPLMVFLHRSTRYRPGSFGSLLLAFIGVFFLRLGLFFSGVADLESTLFLSHILMAGGSARCMVLLAKEWAAHREKTALLFLIGFGALAGCLLVSLVLFMFTTVLDYSAFFRIMLMLMMGAMFYEIFCQFAAMAKKGIENQLYHRLAYTDSLTDMLNRMAFQEEMHALETAPDCHMLTVAVFDINRLKYANDTYGHSAGDELIKNAARNITGTFGVLGSCYRIGGDEFAVLLKDCPAALLEETLARFHTGLAHTPPVAREQLQIAVGCATGPAQGQGFAYKLFDQADQAMYQDKTASVNE